jgi:hypothetical protein
LARSLAGSLDARLRTGEGGQAPRVFEQAGRGRLIPVAAPGTAAAVVPAAVILVAALRVVLLVAALAATPVIATLAVSAVVAMGVPLVAGRILVATPFASRFAGHVPAIAADGA